MAFKVNYGLARAERNRAKQEKKEAKARERKAGIAADDEAVEPLARETPDEDGTPLA